MGADISPKELDARLSLPRVKEVEEVEIEEEVEEEMAMDVSSRGDTMNNFYRWRASQPNMIADPATNQLSAASAAAAAVVEEDVDQLGPGSDGTFVYRPGNPASTADFISSSLIPDVWNPGSDSTSSSLLSSKRENGEEDSPAICGVTACDEQDKRQPE